MDLYEHSVIGNGRLRKVGFGENRQQVRRQRGAAGTTLYWSY